MKRVLLGLALGALIFGVSFAGAKVATVTNPMGGDLDGGGHTITNVSALTAGSLQAVSTYGFFPDGLIQGGEFSVANLAISAPSITSGLADPTVSCPAANPASLYLREVTQPPTTGELWVKVANPCGWLRVAS